MPIKWTPEADQILLLKILETCNVTANVTAISEAWPEDRDRPTPRAISERLFKIRNTTKNSNGTASLTVSQTGKGPAPFASSLKKAAVNGRGKTAKAAVPFEARKRKRNVSTCSAACEDTHAVKHEDSDIEYLASSPVRNGKKAKTTTETKPKSPSVTDTAASTVKPEYPTFNDYFLEEIGDTKARANAYTVEEDDDSEEDGEGVAI